MLLTVTLLQTHSFANMKKMIWSRLKNMKCPNCNGAMAENTITHGIECKKCSMFIRKDKFEQIINSLYTGKPLPESNIMKNLSELNNL